MHDALAFAIHHIITCTPLFPSLLGVIGICRSWQLLAALAVYMVMVMVLRQHNPSRLTAPKAPGLATPEPANRDHGARAVTENKKHKEAFIFIPRLCPSESGPYISC